MTVYSPAEIRKFAYDAGFRGQALDIAVAIALAESGGNSVAYNPETAAGTAQGSGSRGLWQIYGTAHPQYNNDGAFDPRVNAQAAFQVYREAGNSFRPWSTFTNGSYANILPSIAGGIMAPVSKAAQKASGTMAQVATAAGKTGAAAASAFLPAPVVKTFENVNKLADFAQDKEKTGALAANLFFIFGGGGLLILGVGLLFWVGREQIASAAGAVVKAAI